MPFKRISSVDITFKLRDGPGLWFKSRCGQEIFLISNKSGPSVGHIQRPIEWIWASSQVVRRPENYTDLSPPSSDKIKNKWSCTSTPPTHHHAVSWDFTSTVGLNKVIF